METEVRSPAKINWTLRVLRRRADGYHEIESLVSAVTFYDELTFSDRAGAGFELYCDRPEVSGDERNLIRRAAVLLAERSGLGRGLSCRLVKRIPVGGGLGGGSSNAATTLLALNRLWGLHWPVERLLDLAGELGSDVPFFLGGGSAVISGRGEYCRPMLLPWRGWIVLMLPALAVSTAAVYRAWDEQGATGGEADLAVAPAPTTDAGPWMSRTFNMLEPAALVVCPALRELMVQAARLAGRPVRLSGSGSTFFTAFDDRAAAEALAGRISARLGLGTSVVQPVEQV